MIEMNLETVILFVAASVIPAVVLFILIPDDFTIEE